MIDKIKIARLLRKNQTEAETKLWKILRNRNFENLKFRRQFPIKEFIVDFCCLEYKIIIELDGKYHLNSAQKEKDDLRDLLFQNLGYSVLRFQNEIVFQNLDSIKSAIINAKNNFHPHPGLLPQRRRSSVLSTKKLTPAQQNLLLNSGINVVEYNAIAIEINDFKWEYQEPEKLIFTSKNAVKSFLKKFEQLPAHNPETFCVGGKTKNFLQQNGFKVIAAEENAATLGNLIAKEYSNEKFVFFCGNKKREELSKILKEGNISFKEIEVYKTSLNKKEFQQEFNGILFFSPSAVKSFTSKNELKESMAFCIGNTTASEAKKHTENIKIATSPSIENVIVQVVKTFKND